MSVSLCMIVKNESANLDACLASVAGLADQLVVVDTGSTDSTPEIARRYGASIYEFPWRDDFSAARNESIRRAAGDWIFWMDADDRLPPRGHAQLSRLFGALPNQNVAYLMTVLCPGPDGGPMSQVPHARLFRNRPDIRWQNRVHEQIVASIERSGGRLHPTDIGIVHVGYATRQAMDAKLERNLRLIDQDLEDRPLDVGLLQARAVTLLGLARSAEALVALNLCEPATAFAGYASNVFALRGEAYAAEGQLHEGLQAVQAGLRRCPGDTKLSFLEAQLLAALEELELAENRLRAQLVVAEQHGRYACADRTIVGFRIRQTLAELLLARGRPGLAEAEARAVIQARPSFGEAYLVLGEALVEQGKTGELERLCAELGDSEDAEIARAILRARQLARTTDAAEGLALLNGLLETYPAHQMVLKAKARLLFDRGDMGQELKACVRKVLEAEPLCVRTSILQRRLTRATFGDLGRKTFADRARWALEPLVPIG